jgi:glycine cleavage system regulatory protein
MKKYAVLSALGLDRVGIAGDLAATLGNRGIDIENSRWTALGGQFAIIVHVYGEQDKMTELERDLATLASNLGIHLSMETVKPTRRPQGASEFLIESFSSGPAGIGAVTGLLKAHDINIEDLETMASPAPWSSDIAFHIKARISIPPSYSVERLRERLSELEQERGLDVVIKPIPSLRREVEECLPRH